jgi:hypothetical protein
MLLSRRMSHAGDRRGIKVIGDGAGQDGKSIINEMMNEESNKSTMILNVMDEMKREES